jgi:glucose-6-phosphate 1-dehydrogenase
MVVAVNTKMDEVTKTPRSDAVVVFGVTGDLAYKEIFPALYGLFRDEGVSVPVVGMARSDWTIERLRERARESVLARGGQDDASLAELVRQLRYVQGDYGSDETYIKVCQALGEASLPLFYMAIPPSVFPVVLHALAASACGKGGRVVVEKPFGRDLESARTLNRILHDYFAESSIFRIDHYLGKEPVQNIAYTRFANSLFDPIWDRHHVRSIQITMAEEFGVKDRGGFYEEAGAIRDVIQNHLLELLAIVTMDPPGGGDPDAMRSEKSRLLKAVRPLEPRNVVRGQYEGYRSAPGVAPDSTVETYAAVRLAIDNWRWAGVPIYIRTGKAMAVTCTEVLVEFRLPPRDTFREGTEPSRSYLRIRISPDVVIALGLRVKVPGEGMVGKDAELTLASHPGDMRPPYQRLLTDALYGNQELFARQDAVEASWRVVEPILGNVVPLHEYQVGGWGPKAADDLIGARGPWKDPRPSISHYLA